MIDSKQAFKRRALAMLFCLCCSSSNTLAADGCNKPSDGSKQLFWGDLHTHTSFSMDAYVLGNQTTPTDAYRFAQGKPTNLSGDRQHRIARPLDFAAVTDHGEYFGLTHVCRTEPERPYCVELAEAAAERSPRGFLEYFLPLLLKGDRNCLVGANACRAAETSLWQETISAAQTANQPCTFTTFVASEWTASPDNLHWHRNLIFANDQVPARAINSFDQPTQEALWQALDNQCRSRGTCEVLAIPHNSNIGMGGAFDIKGHTATELALRARFEKLVEIHQHKGNSECYPGSPLSDEACNFEIALPIPIQNALQQAPRELTAAEREGIASGYVRNALAVGLSQAAGSGVNPFQYGFVGATDNHSGRPGDVTEQQWAGSLNQWDDTLSCQQNYPNYNPGGLTGIWAEENTRAALFAALQRREVYATSGPRIALKFTQSFKPPRQCAGTDANAVSMGSTFTAQRRRAPQFTVRALQDRSALARVDIIKLYLREGAIEQQVQSWQASATGKADWCVRWQDSDYRADEFALWYARVHEVATLRWDQQTQIRERAWSSPIWSVPKNFKP